MRNILNIFVSLMLITLAFSSCITTRDTNYMQDIPTGYEKIVQEPYRVIPGDKLSVSVFTVDEEISELFGIFAPIEETMDAGVSGSSDKKTINVYADGTINFPYIGKLYVQDMTVQEIGQLLTTKMGQVGSNSAGTIVNVYLANRYFSLLGEMGASRVIMPKNRLTIYEALAISGSISNIGNKSQVSILRQTKDGSVLKTFDIRTIDIIDSEFYYIQPNDLIYVPKMNRQFFGAATSFTGVFALVTGFAGLVTFLVRLF